MNLNEIIKSCIFCLLLFPFTSYAEVVYVSSQQEFDNAHDNAEMNDSIVWHSGIYSDIYMNISKDDLYISADSLGGTAFTGASRVNLTGDNITFRGFQFIDGDIGTNHVIICRGSNVNFTQLNIRDYTCYKYLIVREESQYVNITYCNFENRLNLDDQNILSLLVDDINPGYHKVQYCSFKNFAGTGNDLGIEPIRIGVSSQADFISRSLVEYCYFTLCNGDGELISNKARQNVFRFNTFENNPKAELVLRHGSESVVYGNFFLNGKGGVRVREGQDHYIYNNYFYEIDDRVIYLQNEDSDPLDNINIAFNTIINCSEVRLGGDGNDKPTNVTFANNIFTDPMDDLFEKPTGTETWISNISSGTLGMVLPSEGITIINPELEENSAGYFGLAENSPAINAALPGYASIPQFEGMDVIDTEVLFDMMGQDRPAIIEEKDLGSNEFPHDTIIQPLATENNTGPSYNSSSIVGIGNTSIMVDDLIDINPNPVSNQINITIYIEDKVDLLIDLHHIDGRKIRNLEKRNNLSGEISILKDLSDLNAGFYTIRATSRDKRQGRERMQILKFVKN